MKIVGDASKMLVAVHCVATEVIYETNLYDISLPGAWLDVDGRPTTCLRGHHF